MIVPGATVTIPQPTALRKQSPAVRALAIGMAVLGLCVFAWGLRYKLSLYEPPHSISHHMPAAKLLTGNERRALPVIDPRTVVCCGALGFLSAFLFSIVPIQGHRTAPAFACSELIPARRRRLSAWAPTAANFIRPPPRSR